MLRIVTYQELIGSLSDDLKGGTWIDQTLPLSGTEFGKRNEFLTRG